jgi:hypothetical protein
MGFPKSQGIGFWARAPRRSLAFPTRVPMAVSYAAVRRPRAASGKAMGAMPMVKRATMAAQPRRWAASPRSNQFADDARLVVDILV